MEEHNISDDDRRKKDQRQGEPDRRTRVFPRRSKERVDDECNISDRRGRDKHHSERRHGERRRHEDSDGETDLP